MNWHRIPGLEYLGQSLMDLFFYNVALQCVQLSPEGSLISSEIFHWYRDNLLINIITILTSP